MRALTPGLCQAELYSSSLDSAQYFLSVLHTLYCVSFVSYSDCLSFSTHAFGQYM